MKTNTYKLVISFIMLLMAMVLSGCKEKDTKSVQMETEAANTEEIAGSTDEAETEVTEGTEEAVDSAQPEGYAMVVGTVDVKEEIVYEEDFEDGQTDFTGRGAAKVSILSNKAKEGKSSLNVTGRTAIWNGATVNLTEKLERNQKYIIKASVMYEKGPDQLQIDCKVEININQYLNFASTVAKKGEWTDITGSIIIPEDTTSADVYFETGFAGGELIDFYVDEITIVKEAATVNRGEIPALKEVYNDLFSVGVAATVNEIAEYRQGLIKDQFNSLTPGNELKPDNVLDYNACISNAEYNENPAVNFSRVEPILQFANDAGMKMRGHTLVWHSQTPRWFFAEGYSNDPSAPLVSKELMLKRMESYIKQVLEYTQKNYPGLIYCWDVVNEAVNTGDGEEGGLRSKDSLWYQVIGPEFIEKAFEYARKYAASDVKLFYNDYNTEDSGKMLMIYELVKGLKEKGLIDGIGLQCHFTMDSPSLIDMEASIRKYAELGLELQVTELDMGLTQNTEDEFLRQAKRYKRTFTILKNLDETGVANITNVTFWGLSDDISWLSKPGQPSYPLLFDNYLLQKPAFWGVILSPDIPLY